MKRYTWNSLIRNMLAVFLISTIGFMTTSMVGASIPVTYTCCNDYTYNNGTQLDSFDGEDVPRSGIQLDNFENLSDWTIIEGVQQVDTINFIEGGQGLELVATSGGRAYTDKIINNNFSNTKNFALWIYVYNVSSFDIPVIYFTSTGSSWSKYFSKSYYESPLSAGWNRIIFDKSTFLNVNGESWDNVMNRIRIAIYPMPNQNTNATLDDLRSDISGNWTVGGVGASQQSDTINFKEGTQGLRLIATNGSSAFTDKSVNVNFSDTNNFVIWTYIENASDLTFIRLYLTSTNTNWTSYFYDTVWEGFDTGWNKLVFNKNSFTNYGGESWNNIMNRMRLRIGQHGVNNANVTFDDLRNNMMGQRAKIMIEFDDGLSSTYANAYPILRANNQTATTFVVTSYVGNSEFMNLDNLRTLQEAGWSISSHTVDHSYLSSLEDVNQSAELNESYNWFVNNNFQKSAGFVAYPFGNFNGPVLDKVKKRYIFGRSTQPDSAQQHLSADDNIRYIQRLTQVYNTTTVQSIEDKIDGIINSKLLGILLFHDIVISNPEIYSYLTTDFQTVSDYIKNRSADIDVVTYSDYVIPNINSFTPVINKTVRIYSNGSTILKTNNMYDEYMPNMTVKPLSDSIDVEISSYNETGGLIRFNESSSNINLQVSYDIGDRTPNQNYSVKIYWENGTKYQDFDISSDNNGHIKYNSVFTNTRYQEINIVANYIPLSITSYSPINNPMTYGTPQTFGINLNKVANVNWYINGSLVQTNSSVVSANYTNSTAGIGIYNITALANDGYTYVPRKWNWTVKDIKPPVTSRTLSGILGKNNWYISNVSVILNATDDMSGVNYTTDKINNGPWINYIGPFLVTNESINTVQYYSIDNSNNKESTKSVTIKIDKTPADSITIISSTNGRNYINWTWLDPTTQDVSGLSYVMVYLNGLFKKNVVKGVMYYNATSLRNNTNYTISTHTVDLAGNINMIWVNSTTRTG